MTHARLLVVASLLSLGLWLPTGCRQDRQPPVRPAAPPPPSSPRAAPFPRARATHAPTAPSTAPGHCFALPPSGEGMWPWADLGRLDEAALRRRGLRISLASLWTPGRGGLAGAVVGVGNGCTGSFVSPTGLVITNHHCAFQAIQRNSTPERDLIATGYLAASRDQELRGYGTRIYVFRNQTDVTRKITAALPKGADDYTVLRAIEAREKALVSACEKKPHTRCWISRENDGLRFLLLENTEIKDLRLVAAPPKALGNYGGESDNFRWPRHTLDFTLMRAYVAPDGTPRAYHKDNVPYRPKHFLRIQPQGIRAGDFVMVLGTPGRTHRYATATEVAWNQHWYYPFRERLFREWIGILRATARRTPAARLPTASRVKTLDNALTHARGMLAGLRRRHILADKRALQTRYRAWLDADPTRRARWGRALPDLAAFEKASERERERDLLLRYLFWGVTLARTLRTVVKWAHEQTHPDADRDPGFQQRDRERLRSRLRYAQRSFNVEADKAVFAYFLKRLAALPPGQRIQAFQRALGGNTSDASIRAFLDRLYANTALTKADARVATLDQPLARLRQSPDPALRLGLALHPELEAWEKRRKTREGARFRLRRPWLDSLIAFRGKRFYPDANLTPRVSFAHVAGYAPRDAVWYRPFTTLAGLLAKETGTPPFVVPAAVQRAARARAHDANAPTRALPVCFLSNADTTGGNSGSPVLDGQGHFVGINFDRVYENVSGDFGYRRDTSRNVMVDVRYILWYLRRVVHADAVLKELGGGAVTSAGVH